ncbi:hypothetical protein MMC25_004086 [Agyrium rufum]|nr:hypothetical protein [Agyrium rufum]
MTPISKRASNTSSLADRLSQELPEGLRFSLDLVDSQPELCDPIFAPPPGISRDETWWTRHFLSISIPERDQVPQECEWLQILAIEVLVYKTASLTTLFVSKADSTGYGYLQPTPAGAGRCPPPTQTILTVFLSWLVEAHQRPNIKSVISLFARSQDQYLFPGSIENPRKHVLDDRKLVKWWCKILDQVMEHSSSIMDTPKSKITSEATRLTSRRFAKGYLKVPGCDIYETKAFLPRSSRTEWMPKDPLKLLQPDSDHFPERCLIPRFSDDPKSRFAIDLDDELPEELPEELTSCVREKDDESRDEHQVCQVEARPEEESASEEAQKEPTASDQPLTTTKIPSDGKWHSVRSLDQFWEMMEFRQECSAGRLVGFIWAVFEPIDHQQDRPCLITESNQSVFGQVALSASQLDPRPIGSDQPISDPLSSQTSFISSQNSDSQPLASSQTTSGSSQSIISLHITSQPTSLEAKITSLDPGSSPAQELIVQNLTSASIPSAAYSRLSSLLDDLDYATLAMAKSSTARWISKAAKEIRQSINTDIEHSAGAKLENVQSSSPSSLDWGIEVIGKKITASYGDGVQIGTEESRGVKRGADSLEAVTAAGANGLNGMASRNASAEDGKANAGVTVLSGMMIKKKKKVQAA